MWLNRTLTNYQSFILKVCFFVTFFICYVQWDSIFTHRDDIIVDTIKAETYSNFEKKHSMCYEHVKEINISSKRENCPEAGIITVDQGGRLGNQIWAYVSVWLVGKKTGLTPVVPFCVKLRLSRLFDHLTLPSFSNISHCTVNRNITRSRVYYPWIYNESIILPGTIVQPELLAENIHDINKIFRIKKNLLQKSQEILQAGVTFVNSSVDTFISVHARRTDYIAYLKRRYKIDGVSTIFFKSAMTYFEKKYPKSIFIFVSDDPKWCWKEFSFKKNVYITGKYHKSFPELDIAIMASCNHSIIDYGTFGQWGALLAGGETIFYEVNKTYSSELLAKYLDNWHTIKIENNLS